MNYQEYIDLQKIIAIGDEINFEYDKKEYWISRTPGKYHLKRVIDSYTQSSESADELFKKAKIDGHHFDEIYPEIPWND